MLSKVSCNLEKLKSSPLETTTDLSYVDDETPFTIDLIDTLPNLNKGPS